MANEDFFNEQSDSSRIKANIVAKYFPSYCRIINRPRPQKEIRYLDLFAGPGVYNDGSWSTPMLIAAQVAEDKVLKNKVHFLFNDNTFIDQLKENFWDHFTSSDFAYEPKFADKTVGNDDRIAKYLVRKWPKPNPHPTLLFFDPWGYKGIDTIQLAQFMESWGNEIFLFVNIKRIHAAIENDKFDQLMELLFPTTIESIRKERRYKATVYERLALIMDNLADEFKKIINGPLFHTAFKFQEENSKTTSHFIIHFTKHAKGYELVKQIYYDFDNLGADLEKEGTYTFDAKRMYQNDTNVGLGFDFGDDNVKALSQALLKTYAGRTISARKLFEEHQSSTKYCGSHYAETLRKMVDSKQIEAKFTDEKNHRVSVTLIDECILKFISDGTIND